MSDDQKLLERLSAGCDSMHPTLGTVVLSVPEARRLLALARKGLEAEKRLIACHKWADCTPENCVLDGGPEHELAFALAPKEPSDA